MITSFLCSIAEAILLSTPLSYVKSQVEQGNRNALTFLKLQEDVDKPLSAILSLNTVAHTVGAAGVGAQAIVVFGEEFFGVVSAVLTILILVVTEIIPKTLGANYYRTMMGFAANTIQIMIFLTYPLVMISMKLTRLLSRKDKEPSTSRAEISALASIGTEEGVFVDKENKIIQNLIKLQDVKISKVMTPRTVVVIANEEMSAREFLKKKEFLHFSRIPIYSESRDNITGYVLREKVFEKLAEDEFHLKLSDLKRKIVSFPEQQTLFAAWEELLKKKEHISLVIDEYGGLDGIATLEDIIESLLGFEIIDEKDKVDNMQQYAREKWNARQKKYRL